MIKKQLVIFLTLVLLLTGCGGEAVPVKGDFRFPMPEGYSLADVTDTQCSIMNEEESCQVGGIEVTGLNPRALTKKGSEDALLYLQEDFHGTNNVEYIILYGGEEAPTLSISLRRHSENGSQKEFSHRLFEREGIVYHMWFDLDTISKEQIYSFSIDSGEEG